MKDKEKTKPENENEKTEPKKLEDYKTMGDIPKKNNTEDKQKEKTIEKKSESAVKKAEKKEDKKSKKQEKVELERTYVVPLRKGFLKVPKYKRAKKAIKTLKEFLAKHMKVEERDLKKVKLDIYLNNEIWFRGIKKPLHKIKVNAKKINGIVHAELSEIPEVVKFNKEKIERKKNKVDKKKLEKVIAKEAAEEKTKAQRSDQSDKEEEKEKKAATIEAGFERQEKQAKAEKHTAKPVNQKMDKMSSTTKRKALKK